MTAANGTSKISTRYAVVTYRPKWISQEIGYSQARSFAGYFKSKDAVYDLAHSTKAGHDGWKRELTFGEIPPTKKTIPDGEEVSHVYDKAKLLNGYFITNVEVYSENGFEGRILGPSIKLEKS